MHAKNMHMSLSENGINAEIDPNTYWGSIDKEMRLRYPEEFEGATTGADASPRSAAKAKTVVSSAKRTTKSKQYVLTDSEARLSHRLGITPEEYVKQKLKLEG